jgi:hypothetical protein
MKRIILTAGAALLVTVPAAIGLVDNTSFAQTVPVRVPPQATLVDDSGARHGAAEHRDDKGGQPSPSTTEAVDDKGGQRDPSPTASTADDKGGQRAAASTGTGGATQSDSGSGEGQDGRHGGATGTSGRGKDGPGHS